jgi:hypothetical protein
MKKIKYAFLFSAAALCAHASAQTAPSGALTGGALVQSIGLSASSQVAVNVGLGPIGSSIATATITPGAQAGAINVETLTPTATVTSGTMGVTAQGPGSTASATGIYSSNVLTIVPVLNGTQTLNTLTLQNIPTPTPPANPS